MTPVARTVVAGSVILSLSALLFSAPEDSPSADSSEPKLASVFPLGGQRGTNVEAELRGESLDGVNGIWCDEPGVKGKIVKVEEVHDNLSPQKPEAKEGKTPPVYRAVVELEIPLKASLGMHPLRVLSPRGISNPVPFRVTDQAVVKEVSRPHQTVQSAQKVELPSIIDGRLLRPGESDYYSFDARKDQELSFQVLMAENFDARLALFRQGGSWFDPLEPTRLLFEEERSSDLIPVHIDGHYRFQDAGEYFLRVSGLYGEGCSDCSYQVRISPGKEGDGLVPERRHVHFNKSGNLDAADPNFRCDWRERSFGRHIEEGWVEQLALRSVDSTGEVATASASAGGGNNGNPVGEMVTKTNAHTLTVTRPVLVQEREPNDTAEQAQEVPIPVLIQGTIDHPRDVDSFKFSVKAGEKLAFEIEAPDAQPPEFNPRIGVTDDQDKELFSNVYRRIALFNNNADHVPYLQNVEPKSLYTFARAGTYVLRVRDITSRYGGPTFQYRILIRPQTPHVGEVEISGGDHVNLAPGQAKTLTLTASYEEGFSGSLSFAFKGLPQGVEALPGSQLDSDTGPTEADVNPEIVVPKYQKTTIILMAGKEAPLTSLALVEVRCVPILGGRPGPSFVAATVPVSVVKAAVAKPPRDPGKN